MNFVGGDLTVDLKSDKLQAVFVSRSEDPELIPESYMAILTGDHFSLLLTEEQMHDLKDQLVGICEKNPLQKEDKPQHLEAV